MIYAAIRCDHCGKEKAGSNHWWIFSPLDYEAGIKSSGIVIAPLNEVDFNTPGSTQDLHLCGDRCVLVKVEEYLTKIRQAAPVKLEELSKEE